MLHLLKSEVFIRVGGWGTRLSLSEFSGSAPAVCFSICESLKNSKRTIVVFHTEKRFYHFPMEISEIHPGIFGRMVSA